MINKIIEFVVDKILSYFYNEFANPLKSKFDSLSSKNKRILIASVSFILMVFGGIIIIYKYTRTDVAIVDVKFEDTDNISSTCIEFTLKNNNSTSDRYIKNATIHLNDYYELSYDLTSFPYILESDYTYDVLFSGNEIPELAKIDLSRVIPAGGFDKFTINVAGGEKNELLRTLMNVSIDFLCDNGEIISSKNIILFLGSDLFSNSFEDVFDMKDLVWRGLYENYQAFKRFSKSKAKYIMPAFKERYSIYSSHRKKIMDIGVERRIVRDMDDSLIAGNLKHERHRPIVTTDYYLSQRHFVVASIQVRSTF